MRQILISAAQKSSGKTTISTGISAALNALGHSVQTFKKGPDYIDPMWLSLASGKPCYNLDFWTQSHTEIEQLFADKASAANFSLIEANKGLYDGLSLDGSDSNAALARLLQSPVVLVLDCRGTIRGIAPLLLGYQAFDAHIRFAGVILNFVGGSRHESKMREVLKTYTNIRCLGAIPRSDRLCLTERYLGLMPSNEDPHAAEKVNSLAESVQRYIDLPELLKISSEYRPADISNTPLPSYHQHRLSIAYAVDEAFGFYYADDLDAFRAMGVDLVKFNTLNDRQLPDVDAIFIGGGFPEKRIAALSANRPLREQLKQTIENGMPVYAECGGLMYLSQSIHYQGESGEMVGVIPADTIMKPTPLGRGYIELKPTANHPWYSAGSANPLRGHEFHYSQLQGDIANGKLVFDVLRGHGINGRQDGVQIHNMVACYAHQRHTHANPWITRFLDFVLTHRKR